MAPPRRPWFRFYTETFTDIEVRVAPVAERWAWAAFLALARISPVAGALLDKAGEPLDDVFIAEFAGLKVPVVRSAIRRYEAKGMLTRSDDGVVTVTRWDSRQFESDDVTERVARHRRRNDDATLHPPSMERSRNGDGTDFAHGPENREQRTDTSLTPPTTSSALAEPGGGDSILTQAAALLAEAEAVRRGNAIGNPGGYIRARTPAIRSEHEPEWRRLLEHAPGMTAEQLVAGEVSADRALIARNERRRNGSPLCEQCEDRGVVELADGAFDDCPCKTKASA